MDLKSHERKITINETVTPKFEEDRYTHGDTTTSILKTHQTQTTRKPHTKKRVTFAQHQDINAATGNYLPIIEVTIGDEPIRSLLDSGAACSIASRSFFENIKHKVHTKRVQSWITLKSVNNQPLEILGCYVIPIKIGIREIKHEIYIVNQSLGENYSMLLGYDFLKQNKLSLNFDKNILEGKGLSLNICDTDFRRINNLNIISYAKLTQKYSLKPYETTLVELKIGPNVTNDKDIVLSPHLKNKDVEINPAIVSVGKGRTTHLLISNITAHKITLKKDTKIATIDTDAVDGNIKGIRKIRREELKESDFNLEHLDQNTRTKLLNLLMKFADVFSKRLGTLGRTDIVQPEFTVKAEELKPAKHFPVPHALKDILRDHLEEMLEAGIIEPSNSYVTFPLVMVKKKNTPGTPQSYRTCVDFRALNKLVTYTNHPLPLMNTEIDKLSGSKLFTTIDLNQSFFQILLKEGQRQYTAFQSPFGAFQFKTMPMGSSFSSATLQKLSDKILAPLRQLKIANFIDDFAFGANTIEEMLSTLEQFFIQLRKYNLTINPKKCTFITKETTFLGHKIDEHGSKPSNENLVKIANFKTPKNLRQVRGFLGLTGYYRRYIKDYSKISTPLTDLLKNKGRFKWNEEAQNAFVILKDALDNGPVLIHPNFDKQFILSTDSSTRAIGGCLSQLDENTGIKRPIAYYSKKLTDTQAKYPIYELELYALTENLRAFKYYVYGRKIIVECDNKALSQIKTLENPATRVTRQILKLQEYDIDFKLIRSKENIVPDILSRYPFENPQTHAINSLTVEIPSLVDIQKEQYEDEELSEIIEKLKFSPETLKLSEREYFLNDNLLLRRAYRPHDNKPYNQIVIPKRYRANILHLTHANHVGHEKTYQNMVMYFYWKGMYRDAEEFVKSCTDCSRYKSPKRYPPAPLQTNILAKRPLEYISIDIVGPVSESPCGHKYILCINDYFTRYMQIYPLKTQKATEVADKLLNFISIFGLFENLLSDCAQNFVGTILTSLAEKLGVTKLKTTSYRPSTNGMNEASHKQLKISLAIYARDNHNWVKGIEYYQLLYNAQKHSTTKYSPYFLMFGFEPRVPYAIKPNPNEEEYNSIPEYVENRLNIFAQVKDAVNEHFKNASEKQQDYRLRTGAKHRTFEIGQKVYLHTPNLERNKSSIKKPSFDGPYEIIQRHNDVNYTIRDWRNPRAKLQRVHIERLLPYQERDPKFELIDNTPNTTPKYIDTEAEANITPTLPEEQEWDEDIPLAYYALMRNKYPWTTGPVRDPQDLADATSEEFSHFESSVPSATIHPRDRDIDNTVDRHTPESPQAASSRQSEQKNPTRREASGGIQNNDNLNPTHTQPTTPQDKTPDPTPKPIKKGSRIPIKRDEYPLRSRPHTVAQVQNDGLNLPMRLWHWAERITRPSEEEYEGPQSAIVTFLDNLKDKLKDD